MKYTDTRQDGNISSMAGLLTDIFHNLLFRQLWYDILQFLLSKNLSIAFHIQGLTPKDTV